MWNDVDPNIELDSSGILKLSISKDMYQELGLNGVPSLCLGKVVAKYSKNVNFIFELIVFILTFFTHLDVSIDLCNNKFQPGSKFYERVLWCFKNRLDLEFDWIMTWKPHGLTEKIKLIIKQYQIKVILDL